MLRKCCSIWDIAVHPITLSQVWQRSVLLCVEKALSIEIHIFNFDDNDITGAMVNLNATEVMYFVNKKFKMSNFCFQQTHTIYL